MTLIQWPITEETVVRVMQDVAHLHPNDRRNAVMQALEKISEEAGQPPDREFWTFLYNENRTAVFYPERLSQSSGSKNKRTQPSSQNNQEKTSGQTLGQEIWQGMTIKDIVVTGIVLLAIINGLLSFF